MSLAGFNQQLLSVGGMGVKRVKLSREELYAQVWSTPMTKLAKQYGLSDRGLAKICKRNSIPCPPRGYWAKLHAGQRMRRTPLPPAKNSDNITIETASVFRTEKRAVEDFMAKYKLEKVPIKKTLRGAHPLVKKTSDYLKTFPKKSNVMLEPPKDAYLDFAVSPSNLKRGLRILDSVLNVLESKGFPVIIEKSETKVRIFDVKIKILLKEEYKTVPKNRKDIDSLWLHKDGFPSKYSSYRYDRVPSGILCLSIDEWVGGGRGIYQKNWRDTKTAVLEDRLPKFIFGLIQIAARKSEDKKKRKEEERLRNERRKALQQKIEEYNLEKERVSGLLEDLKNWEKATALRKYITEVEVFLKDGKEFSFIKMEPKNWLEWAYAQADRLDPLTPSPPSILDETEQLEEASRINSLRLI